MTSWEQGLAAEGPSADFPRKCAALGGGGQGFGGTSPPVCLAFFFLDHFLLCVLEATLVYILFLVCSKHTFVLFAKILPLACLIAALPMTCWLLGKICGPFLFNWAHSFCVSNITILIDLNAHSQRKRSVFSKRPREHNLETFPFSLCVYYFGKLLEDGRRKGYFPNSYDKALVG